MLHSRAQHGLLSWLSWLLSLLVLLLTSLESQTVGDRVGRNEKTKVVCRLQGKGSGPPAREPAVSEEDRRAMMAHYFKRQEELKKVAENDDDAFMHSTWANPRGLKQSLLGTSGVAFRPGRR